MPSPITVHAARNTERCVATARRRRPVPSSAELAARTGRPPRAWIARPTPGETRLAARSPSERPPTTKGSGQPVSAAMGFARTAGR
jgi:hypothetical protein